MQQIWCGVAYFWKRFPPFPLNLALTAARQVAIDHWHLAQLGLVDCYDVLLCKAVTAIYHRRTCTSWRVGISLTDVSCLTCNLAVGVCRVVCRNKCGSRMRPLLSYLYILIGGLRHSHGSKYHQVQLGLMVCAFTT